jgi:hypothetical protein
MEPARRRVARRQVDAMTDPQPDYATTTAVAGLARELEALRRSIESVQAASERVEDLAAVVADLAAAVEEVAKTPRPAPPACWLDFADDTATAFALLTELAGWLAAVYLRYGDAVLPDCWLFHPDVVEELLWLSQAWQAAYAGPRASITAVGDWHDRQRPGVTRRIGPVARSCSIENHQPGHPQHTGPPDVPLTDATNAVAAWWATHRGDPPPAPTAEQLAVTTHRTSKGRR